MDRIHVVSGRSVTSEKTSLRMSLIFTMPIENEAYLHDAY